VSNRNFFLTVLESSRSRHWQTWSLERACFPSCHLFADYSVVGGPNSFRPPSQGTSPLHEGPTLMTCSSQRPYFYFLQVGWHPGIVNNRVGTNCVSARKLVAATRTAVCNVGSCLRLHLLTLPWGLGSKLDLGVGRQTHSNHNNV
jgi:hypothetical protein